MTSVDRTAEPMPSPYECEHRRLSLPRLRRIGGGLTQCRRQCLDCGAPIGPAIAKAAAEREGGGRIEDFDAAFEQRAEALAKAKREAEWAATRAERRRLYDAYLASDAWWKKRAAVMRRCGGICEGCGEAPAVEVHHRTYEHFGAELLFELVGLCRSCHATAHDAEAIAHWLWGSSPAAPGWIEPPA
jgi:hypothetical protein